MKAVFCSCSKRSVKNIPRVFQSLNQYSLVSDDCMKMSRYIQYLSRACLFCMWQYIEIINSFPKHLKHYTYLQIASNTLENVLNKTAFVTESQAPIIIHPLNAPQEMTSCASCMKLPLLLFHCISLYCHTQMYRTNTGESIRYTAKPISKTNSMNSLA